MENSEELKVLHTIMEIFCNAIGMEVNAEKYNIYTNKIQVGTLIGLNKLFQFKNGQMEDGFRYLGFILKLNNYRVND